MIHSSNSSKLLLIALLLMTLSSCIATEATPTPLPTLPPASPTPIPPTSTPLPPPTSTPQTPVISTENIGELRAARTFGGIQNIIRSLAIAPDGETLIVGTGGSSRHNVHRLHVLDVLSGGLIAQSGELNTIVWDLAYSPRGDLIASAMDDGSVTLWDPMDLSQLDVIQHDGAVNSVAFSPDGDLLAAGVASSEGGVVQIWRLEDRTILHRFWAHAYSVPAMSFSPSGQYLATGAVDRTVKVWQVSNGQQVRALPQDGQGISLAFSSDGSQLASAMCALSDANADCQRGEVWLWRVSDWERIHVLGGPVDWVESVVFSPVVDLVVGGGRDFGVYVWDASDGRLLRTLIGHQGVVDAIAFAPDGRFLATGSSDQKVIIWEISP